MQVDWWSIITIRSLLRPMLGENQEHRTCSQTRSVVCIVCPGASFRCMTTLGADESQPMGLGASGRYHGVRQGCLVSAQRHDMGQKTLPQTSEKTREPTPPRSQHKNISLVSSQVVGVRSRTEDGVVLPVARRYHRVAVKHRGLRGVERRCHPGAATP